jgi:hypothetical protein
VIQDTLPCLLALQTNAAGLLPADGPNSLPYLSGLSFSQILADGSLLALAQANGYSSVSDLFPGINAFSIGVSICCEHHGSIPRTWRMSECTCSFSFQRQRHQAVLLMCINQTRARLMSNLLSPVPCVMQVRDRLARHKTK